MKLLRLTRFTLMLLGLMMVMGDINGQMIKPESRGVKPMNGNPVKGTAATRVDYSSADKKIVGKFQMEGNYWMERNNQGVNKFTETGRDEWSVYLKDVSRAGVTVQLDLWVKKVICKPWNSKYIVTGAQGGHSTQASFPDPNAFYTIVARHSNRALDVPGASNENGKQIQQYNLHGNANQQFKFVPAGGGYFFIKVKSSGKYLDVAGANANNGAAIIQWTLHRGPNQQFKLANLGGGYYRIIAKHSGKAFDITGGINAKGNGVKLQQYSAVGGQNQHFRIKKR